MNPIGFGLVSSIQIVHLSFTGSEKHHVSFRNNSLYTVKEKMNTSCSNIKEVIETARKVTGHPIPAKEEARRAGDPARLVASGEKARKILGWEPEIKDLADIISSAWKWHKAHRDGYSK